MTVVRVRPVFNPSFPSAVVGDAHDICYSAAVPADPSSGPSMALPRAALDQVDALYNLARRLTGNDGDAEDLVQDTFARALGAQSQFAAGTNVKAWLFRILRNLHIDKYRRARKSPLSDGEGRDDWAEDGGSGREPLRGDEDLERMRGIVGEDIEAALRSLPPDTRTVVLLDAEGFTEGELAEVLGCSVGTIKSRLSRARATLRERLRDYARQK
ncbi:MAG: sigma-70 family RNA polymerase sigma factor [Myxococcota bacterium]|nr:sigma-70 family RNA polymerase sigma factor [Myxococcota bacterium]